MVAAAETLGRTPRARQPERQMDRSVARPAPTGELADGGWRMPLFQRKTLGGGPVALSYDEQVYGHEGTATEAPIPRSGSR
mmetsp:Transcript_15063/g.38700  ORF Transcript_15063/g.38700 Transcript_15063/m.38700 type:complete len:81 (-) Transcript_15063:50-292(-)